MKNKNSVILYNATLPIIALIVIAGYIAVKNPKLVNQIKNKIQNSGEVMQIEEQEKEEVKKPSLENTQKLEIPESQLNALIKAKIGDINIAGYTVDDASVDVNGDDNMITGSITISNGMEVEFKATPSTDRLGIDVEDLVLANNEDSVVFSLVKGALKPALQTAINKVIDENAEDIRYLEVEGDSIVIYLNEN